MIDAGGATQHSIITSATKTAQPDAASSVPPRYYQSVVTKHPRSPAQNFPSTLLRLVNMAALLMVLVLCSSDENDAALASELQLLQGLNGKLPNIHFSFVNTRRQFNDVASDHHIAHIVAHGYNGFFSFLDAPENSSMSMATVVEFVASLPPSLELLVMHTCESSFTQSPLDPLLRSYILCDDDLLPASCAAMSQAIYRGLSAGKSLQQSFTVAQRELIAEHDDPQLDLVKDQHKYHLIPCARPQVLCVLDPPQHATSAFFAWMISQDVSCFLVGYPAGCFSISSGEEQEKLTQNINLIEGAAAMRTLGVGSLTVGAKRLEFITAAGLYSTRATSLVPPQLL